MDDLEKVEAIVAGAKTRAGEAAGDQFTYTATVEDKLFELGRESFEDWVEKFADAMHRGFVNSALREYDRRRGLEG